MKVVFFGTPSFAAYILEDFLAINSRLNLNHQLVAVVSKPDKPQGRSLKKEATEVKKKWGALELSKENIPFFQPEKTEEIEEELKALEADLFIVVAYGEIIKENILKIPKLGAINVHASLLPKYRGASPIRRAILEGEKETGITIIHLVKKMDAGAMIAKGKVSIGEDESFGQLEEKLKVLGVETLFLAIDRMEKGLDPKEEQIEALVTFAPKTKAEDTKIDWEKSALSIHRQICAFSPKPGAWAFISIRGETKRVKILASSFLPPETYSGNFSIKDIVIYDKSGIVVASLEGFLKIEVLQLEGKKEVNVASFVAGFPREFVKII